MYKAIGSPGSRISRVVWMLEELDEAYEIASAKPYSETAREFNPSGKVPALVDGDFVLTDSAAICVYLGEKHSDKNMGSRNPQERAQIDSWMQYLQSEFEAPMWNKIRHKFILPEELRLDISPWAAWEFAKEIKTFDRRLGENEFAMGDRFTAVDILAATCANWARAAKFEIPSKTVEDYFDRVLARPAHARSEARIEEVRQQKG